MAVAASTEGVPLARVSRSQSLTAVRIWIYGLAALVVLMIAVGGATRLTGSGLSITEWKPVTGAIPPLTEQAWLAEFEKYKQISQYELLNKGMTLSEFKFIYAWEWGHRQLGRLIGLAFFLPLIWFWARGAIKGKLALTLLSIGALGGLQGTIGWIMVASGLEPGMTAVAPIKLALHLTVASIILVCLVWVASGLKDRSATDEVSAGSAPRILLGLILLQIALGGLVAGSKAGMTYNTWPLMDGALVPPSSALFSVKPWIENFVDNVVLVQFNHRLVAYALVAFALWHAWTMRRKAPDSKASRRATAMAGLTLGQMALGIVTLLLVVPLWAGLAHQVFAMAVLAMATVHARVSAP
ncbi:cytochrome c oxidase assembly protein subunit 15 [Microvirga flocculans]|uniref:Heme A synthase n=1 Tax=Microvirga flocculans TaxID=217168 RepID=A0A7W6IG98_9HYPH|nr:COX15/CtaA family protein [Microvirga flocculans]MBB4040954.1 cytochrome c oxidase assembly protein subunit 15 [Microvirga flocculans]